ncbi:hypothetical protein [Photobacterium rosenbergii]|uniref:hypothetical protein n=1 Tax=Photobacterium rosenbergii TaxID=294936 RepID=UPI001C98E73F|nr:hypothetical protein [Photobacterium rosenbergii]MBY5945878.1 hypothetical protein [Photobacterium rosenbergii]
MEKVEILPCNRSELARESYEDVDMRKTKAMFVDESRAFHNGKYSYENFVYINAKTKSFITCPIHGDFEQRPDAHLAGRGCPQCSGKKKRTKEEFVEKAHTVHQNKYNYEKFVYLGSLEKGIIICPIHGEFEQRPNSHLAGKGCPQCSRSSPVTQEQFVQRANAIHHGKYRYDNFVYAGALTKATITCPLHGDFEQRPDTHLRGAGCPVCAKHSRKKTTDEFVLQALRLHRQRYSYEHFEYVNARTKGKITCSIHGVFEQHPYNHLAGNGCPHCASESRQSPIMKPLSLATFKPLKDYPLVALCLRALPSRLMQITT